jgi:hypothetical protein
LLDCWLCPEEVVLGNLGIRWWRRRRRKIVSFLPFFLPSFLLFKKLKSSLFCAGFLF